MGRGGIGERNMYRLKVMRRADGLGVREDRHTKRP